MLSIVSIIYKNLQEIERTCVSVEQQGSGSLEHIVVASGFQPIDKDALLKRWESSHRTFIFDQDRSLYNAMNIGLAAAKGNCILFLNGGDTLASPKSLSMIIARQRKSCLAFSTAQRYEHDLYIRPPCKVRNGRILGFCHQGFVAPLDPDQSDRIYYNEQNYIAADQEWVRENIKRYGVELQDEVLSVFRLGGISNRPSFNALKLQLQSGNVRSALRLLPKLFLHYLVSPKRYYNLLARLNRYEVVKRR